MAAAAVRQVIKAVRIVSANGRMRRRERYSDLPSMMVGLMSVNLAMSALTSAIAGFASAVCRAWDEANVKWAIITYGAATLPIGTPSISLTLAAFMTFITSGMWVER